MKVLVVYAHWNPKSFTHALVEEFTRGLEDGGHTSMINDLYANKFDPCYNTVDVAFAVHETVPSWVMEQFDVRQGVLDGAGTGIFGPIKKAMAKRWMRDKDLTDIAEMISQHKPKDVLKEQEKVAWADAIALIAPNLWMGFPAILKGWMTRVFTYGFAYTLTPEGWQGSVAGRVSGVKLKKALIMQAGFLSEEDYRSTGLEEAMRKTIDMWAFEYLGVPDVQRVMFYSIYGVDDQTRRGYLQTAYKLGQEF
jgi:NAD(P)H dehydrogenase (quinone)